MTIFRIKGFQIFRDRHGKLRCYHRLTGKPINVTSYPLGSLGFFAECERIRALCEKVVYPKPGTLSLLIQNYKSHFAFQDLAVRTRSDYDKVFDYLKPIGDTQLVRFTPPFVINIRDKAANKKGRRFANYVKTVMALIFAWGVERGFLPTNPAFRIKGIKRPKNAPEANRPWDDDERDAVSSALPAHMRLPIALMMYCALDPQDAVKVPRSVIQEGKIDMRRGKTGEAAWYNLPDNVVQVLQESPAHDAITLCANSFGRSWTVSGLRASWRPIRKRLEDEGLVRPGLTLKGLRHTVATILAEMGYDERTVADMLAHKTIEMARHYSRRANKAEKMNAVVEKFDKELNRRRTKVVKPA